jgi:hypothetical protein
VRRWFDEVTFSHIPSDIWALFDDPRFDSARALASVRAWAEHVKHVRTTSFPADEEHVWRLVNARWVSVWASFVRKMRDEAEGMTPAKPRPDVLIVREPSSNTAALVFLASAAIGAVALGAWLGSKG